MKITLVLPPVWDYGAPYPSLPYLTAKLRSCGFDVRQRDLNIESYEHIISDEYVMNLQNDMQQFINSNPNEENEIIKEAIRLTEALHGEIDKAKQLLRTSFDFMDTARAEKILHEVRRIIAYRYYNAEFPFDSYDWNRNRNTLLKSMQDAEVPETNIFYDYFKNIAVPDILSESVDLLGISIIHSSQLIPALTFAKLLKERSPDTYVVIGGPMVNQLVIPMKKKGRFVLDKFIDSMIMFEGETAICKLAEELNSGRNFINVPGLVWDNAGSLTINEPYVEDINDLPLPDFSDYKWELYLSPEKVIPYLTSRGCFWNHCTFCSLIHEKSHKYRARDIEKIISDIKELSDKYGTKFFSFNDEAIEPSRIKKMSQRIIEENIPIKWYTMCRLDKNLTEEILDLAARAGCKMISFGLESASQKVLELMKKGTVVSTSKEVISASSRSGIWTHVFLIVGFPGEKLKDSLLTVSYIEENADSIDSFSVATFNLEGGCYVHNNPDSYEIEMIDVPEDFYGPTYPFVSGSLNNEEKRDILKKLDWVADGLGLGRTQYTGYDNRRMLIALSTWGRDGVKKILQYRRIKRIEEFGEIDKLNGKVEASIWNRTKEDAQFKVVINSMTGDAVRLNKSAAKLLELMDGEIFIGQLVEDYVQMYSIPYEQAKKDIVSTLYYFIDTGIAEYKR